MLSQNRKLTAEQVEVVKENVKKHGSKLELVVDIHKEGTQSILRDVSNIRAVVRKDCLGDKLPAVLDVLKKYGK